MAKYKVNFATTIKVYAENKEEARQKALDSLMEQVGESPSSTLINQLGTQAEKVEVR